VRLSSKVLHEPGQLIFRLHLFDAPSAPIQFQVRIPDWAGRAEFSLNGYTVASSAGDGYASVERAWTAGDDLEVRFPLQVRVHLGQTLGRHVLFPDEAAVFYGPYLFSLNDSLNPSVRLHLARLKLPDHAAEGFTVRDHTRLEAAGVTPDRPSEWLIFSPLMETGGTPSGSGRIHTVRSPYYKVWIPVDRE
jgi:DUF1680 family protein